MSKELRYGPNTAAVERMLERLRHATVVDLAAFGDVAVTKSDARGAVRTAIRESGRTNAGTAAWDALWSIDAGREPACQDAWGVAWAPVWFAIQAVLVRDLISPADFDLLVASWREVFGPTWKKKNKR